MSKGQLEVDEFSQEEQEGRDNFLLVLLALPVKLGAFISLRWPYKVQPIEV